MGDPESEERIISNYSIGILIQEGIRLLSGYSTTLANEIRGHLERSNNEQEIRDLISVVYELERGIANAHGNPYDRIRRELGSSTSRALNSLLGFRQELVIVLDRTTLDERYRSGEQDAVNQILQPLGRRIFENLADSVFGNFENFIITKHLDENISQALRYEISMAIRRASNENNREGNLTDLLSAPNQRESARRVGDLIASYVDERSQNGRLNRLAREYFEDNTNIGWRGVFLVSRTDSSSRFLFQVPQLLFTSNWREQIIRAHPHWNLRTVDHMIVLLERYVLRANNQRASAAFNEVNRMTDPNQAIRYLQHLLEQPRLARIRI